MSPFNHYCNGNTVYLPLSHLPSFVLTFFRMMKVLRDYQLILGSIVANKLFPLQAGKGGKIRSRSRSRSGSRSKGGRDLKVTLKKGSKRRIVQAKRKAKDWDVRSVVFFLLGNLFGYINELFSHVVNLFWDNSNEEIF